MTLTDTPTWRFETPASREAARLIGTPVAQPNRRERALAIRQQAAKIAYNRPHHSQETNGDDERYPNRIGSFTKGLPHNRHGEVEPAAYNALLSALHSGRPSDFEKIPLGLGRRLTSPQAGLAYDLEGPDARAVGIRPAPRLDSAEAAGEMVELYWMALLRDVEFSAFECDPRVDEAAASLSRLADFRGPKDTHGKVTPATIFRGFTRGDLIGPYLSQFLLLPISFGSLQIEQRQETVVPGIDYMTDYNAWLHVQNGGVTGKDKVDPIRRYIRNMRDLGQYVHIDKLYQAYLNAALILQGLNANDALVDAGNPYKHSRNQAGFATFGDPHLLSLVTEVATRALKAAWHQKWYVHRRLRPEAYGGLVHQAKQGYHRPIHADMLHSNVLERVYHHNGGSYLLPMAFPEGSPTHPAYAAGHATVAGACVTVLKAWFDETFVLPEPVVPSANGTALVPYTGADADRLTVGNELNKVAANVGIGRNMAGVHWRSDYVESLRLGEQVAIGILEEQSLTYNESASFTFTTFDGEQVLIRNGQTTVIA